MANTKITTNVIADDAITTAKIADDAVGNDQLASGLTLGGNTAATLSTAAQPNITSLGTLTALQVDNININGNTISNTDSNGNLVITPNGTGNVNINTDTVGILGTEGSSAKLSLQADEADDNADIWSFVSNTNNTLTVESYISGASVAHMTLTPNATVAASTVTIPGKVGIGATSLTRELTVQENGQSDISIVAATNQYGQLLFGDTDADNKGIVAYNNTTDILEFWTSGSNRMSIDSGGHVGIKTTTREDGSTAMAFPLTINGANDGGNIIEAFRTANSKFQLYMATSGTSYIDIDGTTPVLRIRTSGTDRVNIHEANGYVGLVGSSDVRLTISDIGTEGDNSANWVRGNSGGLSFNASSTEFKWEIGGTEKMCLDNNAFLSVGNDDAATLNAASGYADICAGKGANDNAGITLYSGTNHAGGIAFADGTSGTDTYRGLIQYSHGSDEFTFWTAATNRGHINSVGQFTFGSASHADDVLYLARNSTAGKILRFYSGGSEVGYISTNTYSLPSDRNFKKDIEDLPLGLDLVKNLKPKQYRQKLEDSDVPLQTGLIAQEVEESLTAAGVSKNKYMMLQHTPNEDEGASQYGIDYGKFIPVLINAIQELSAEVESLKEKLNG